jgi:hypothetical protein
MPWAKVDDKLHGHPKAAGVGLEALGLHLLAMSYCAAYETDGHVPANFPTEKAGKRAAALVAKLTEAPVDASGLWETNGNGWVIHDWLEYNPSKAEAAALVEAKRRAGKAGGEAKAKR